MSTPSGVIIFFDESQRAQLISELATTERSKFSDALSVPDWKLRELELGLLAFSDSTIDFMALLKRGKRVTTAKYKVEFSDLIYLNALPIKQVEDHLSEELRPYFVKASRGLGGRLPAETWNETVNLIKTFRPLRKSEIERLLSLREFAGYELVGSLSEVLVQEREALGAALDIFSKSNQLREQVLGSWAPPKKSVINVNDELKQAEIVPRTERDWAFTRSISESYRVNEESALQHDLFNWPRMSPLHQVGRSVFTQGKRRLEVYYANRNTLEHTLGVDLIYYNADYELFALVQYKLMKQKKDHASDDRMVYRPDKYILQELDRMDEFIARYGPDGELDSHKDFRLNSDGFFIKLIPNRGLRPATGELIRGMYITREYMKFLLGPKGPKGKGGGSLIDLHNAPRALANSEFIQVVSNGWVGMRKLHVKALKDLIRQYYETGRAILLAYEM
jgi:hypothetical protein